MRRKRYKVKVSLATSWRPEQFAKFVQGEKCTLSVMTRRWVIVEVSTKCFCTSVGHGPPPMLHSPPFLQTKLLPLQMFRYSEFNSLNTKLHVRVNIFYNCHECFTLLNIVVIIVTRLFQRTQTSSGTQPASYLVGTEGFLRRKSGQGVKLTSYLLQVPRLRMSDSTICLLSVHIDKFTFQFHPNLWY